MRSLVRMVVISLIAGLGVFVIGSAPVQAADMDCGDFPTQAAAQAYYIAHGGPARDPDRLDADHNGVACESNGCPCSTATSSGPAPVVHTPAKLRVVNVLSGELVRVRRGTAAPYVVHLMGVQVPPGRCRSRAALRDLRSWVRPGMEVRERSDARVPRRDRKGHVWRYLVRVRGNYDIGGSQVRTGFARVAPIRFALKAKYQRWAKRAKAQGAGYYSKC